MDFMDELCVFWIYWVYFTGFIALAGVLEKIMDKCPKVERFFERLFDVDLSEEDEEMEVSKIESNS